MRVDAKRCTKCGKHKPLEAFNSRPDRPLGVTSRCKACTADAQRKYAASKRPMQDPRWCTICGVAIAATRSLRWKTCGDANCADEHRGRQKAAWRKANRDSNRAKSSARSAARRAYVNAKKDAPCVSCGVYYPGEPWLMDYDHIDPATKSANVAALVGSGSSEARIDQEIAKSRLLCVVCHRRHTYGTPLV